MVVSVVWVVVLCLVVGCYGFWFSVVVSCYGRFGIGCRGWLGVWLVVVGVIGCCCCLCVGSLLVV